MAVLYMALQAVLIYRCWILYRTMHSDLSWCFSHLSISSLSVLANEPHLYVRRKISILYSLKLSSHLQNPSYNTVFNSKFKVSFEQKLHQIPPFVFCGTISGLVEAAVDTLTLFQSNFNDNHILFSLLPLKSDAFSRDLSTYLYTNINE